MSGGGWRRLAPLVVAVLGLTVAGGWLLLRKTRGRAVAPVPVAAAASPARVMPEVIALDDPLPPPVTSYRDAALADLRKLADRVEARSLGRGECLPAGYYTARELLSCDPEATAHLSRFVGSVTIGPWVISNTRDRNGVAVIPYRIAAQPHGGGEPIEILIECPWTQEVRLKP